MQYSTKDNWRLVDWFTILLYLLMVAAGWMSICGACYEYDVGHILGSVRPMTQLVWIGVSLGVAFSILLIDRDFFEVFPYFIYVAVILLLVATIFLAPDIKGSRSWLVLGPIRLQPAEFAKIFVILTFSYVITKIQARGRDEISRPTRLGLALLVVIVPVLLIIKQPDYGTALAFLVATVLILFSAGIKKRYIFTSILIILIAVPLLYFFVLPEHAKTRIDVFLNPNLDPRGAGYNIIQSKLAIGSGQLFGMGLLKGNQTQLGFLYPKTTDFVFAVIGEEMGFVVTAGIVICYIILITKAIYVAKTAKDDLGSYIAMGIAGIFLFHMVENIGMTIGLLPITGVPLPFVSYGGSSLLTNLILIALLLNISGRRQKTLFVE